MRSLLVFLLSLVAVPTGLAGQVGSGPDSDAPAPIIVLVRHAEKAAEPAEDPPLTEAGRERAATLAALLGRSGVTAVLSSDYERTRATAGPLAEAAGLGVETYDPGRLEELAADLLSRTGLVVVVGHSNTTPPLVEHLGGDPGEPIAEEEYDRLYLVYPGKDGQAATVVLRF